MPIRIWSKEEEQRQCQPSEGEGIDLLEEMVCEALRGELYARGVSSRSSLCLQVASLLKPFYALDVEKIKGIVERLIRQGDITEGTRGMVASTPLRVTELSAGRYLLAGTLPTALLVQRLGIKTLQSGWRRIAEIPLTQKSVFQEKILSIKGKYLTIAEWIRFHTQLAAGQGWLERLSFLLERESLEAGSQEDEMTRGWQAYLPNEATQDPKKRWGKKPKASAASSEAEPRGILWRNVDCFKSSRYAWTEEGSPKELRFLPLSQDEALRTQYALDRLAQNELRIKAEKRGTAIQIRLPRMLPYAEYRYLLALGRIFEEEEKGLFYEIHPSDFIELSRNLTERLGLYLEEVV
jgi:hypothetical protein